MKYGLLTKRKSERDLDNKENKSIIEHFFENSEGSPCEVENILDLQALYSAGKKLENRIERFLQASPSDNAKSHQRKLEQAKSQYQPYFSQIINFYSGYLFSFPFSIKGISENGEQSDLPDFYSEFKEDSTGNGVDFHDFLRARFDEALITGRAAFVIQLPQLDISPRTRLEWEQMGAGRATLKEFAPLDVIDWEHDASGKLIWVILRDRKKKRVDPRQSDNLITERFFLYTDSELSIFEAVFPADKRPSKDDEIPELARFEHGFSDVPVCLIDLPEGLHLGERIKGPAIANFKARAKRAIMTNTHASTIPILKTENKEDVAGAFGRGFAIVLNNTDEFTWTNPPAEALSNLEEEIQDTKSELFRSANLHFLSESSETPWRSGIAKQINKDSGLLAIKFYAGLAKELAEKTYNLISRARGENIRFSVEGFEHITDMAIENLVKTAETIKRLSIPSQTYSKELSKRITLQSLPDLDESTKEQIKEEIQNSEPEETEGQKLKTSTTANTPSNGAPAN